MVQNHLVLLPGLDGTGDLFAPFVQLPANTFTCHVVSYPRTELLNYNQLLPRVRGVMPWDQSYVLVAESFAGPLALQVASAQPEHIKAIVLVASFVANPIHPLLDWARFLAKDFLSDKPLPEAALRKFLIGEDCPPAVAATILGVIRSIPPPVVAHRVRMARETDARGLLAACEKPLLYIAGKQDKIIGNRGLQAIRAIKPDVSSVEIDAPHLVLQRRPADALRAIEKFLCEKGLSNRGRYSAAPALDQETLPLAQR